MVIAYVIGLGSLDAQRSQPAVASLGGGEDRPGETLQGVTPEQKKMWPNLQRTVDKQGRTVNKGAG